MVITLLSYFSCFCFEFSLGNRKIQRDSSGTWLWGPYGREKSLRQKLFKSKYGPKTARLSRRHSRASVLSAPMERFDSKESEAEDTLSFLNFMPEQNRPQYENQCSDNLVSP